MKSPWIEALRSVAFDVPDLAAAEAFYTGTWRLDVAQREPGVLYLRGSGDDHHLLALHQRDGMARLRQVTLRARSAAALAAVAQATATTGAAIERRAAALDPAGGESLLLR